MMLQATLFWLVHELADSPIYLGYLGLANAAPAIALNLFGGVFADRLDKRRLITTTQTILAAVIVLLALLTQLEVVRVWHVLTLAFVSGAVAAFDQPARQSLYPHLIDRRVMMSAVALNSSIWQGTRIVAPALAGLIIATAGTATAFYVAAAGFLAMAAIIFSLDVPTMERGATGSAISGIIEGVSFVRTNSVFSFLIGMTFFNSFFGMAYLIMMPVFAEEILGQGAGAYGVLLSVGGVGALLATLWVSSRKGFGQRGLLLIGGATTFGLSVATFSLTSEYVGSYPLALALTFTMGVCSSVYMISIMSSLQLMVPDGMRGRVMGIYGMTWSIMPLGGMQAAAVAGLIGVPFAVAIGGLAVSAFALGPGLLNARLRGLGTLLQQFEATQRSRERTSQPSSTVADR